MTESKRRKSRKYLKQREIEKENTRMKEKNERVTGICEERVGCEGNI